jgi:hypothetical protein
MYLIKLLCLTFVNLVKQVWLLPQGLHSRGTTTRRHSRETNSHGPAEPAAQGRAYQFLAVVFGIAGLVWIVYGLMSPRWVLYPVIGVLNLIIACVCKWHSGTL